MENLDSSFFAAPDSIFANRFWSKVDIKSTYDCWEWAGARDGRKYNYGRAFDGAKVTYSHIIAYKLTYGDYPPRFSNGRKVVVRHKCGNYGCCNPNHLDIGTQSDNMKDVYNARNFNVEQRKLRLVSK